MPSETIKFVSKNRRADQDNILDPLSPAGDEKEDNQEEISKNTKEINKTVIKNDSKSMEAIENKNITSTRSNGVTLRDECCPCLLENLDATTSILLQIYNEDRDRRNRTMTKDKSISASTKTKRSVTSNDKVVKKKNDKKKKNKTKRKHRRKKRKRDKRQKGLFSQLDVCCLCNFLPEEDISLLSATSSDESSATKTDSSISTTQRTEITTTSKKFSHDLSTIRVVQETTPSTNNASDKGEELDNKFKDMTTTNPLLGFP